VTALLDRDILRYMGALLDSVDIKTIAVVLEGIYYLLKFGGETEEETHENIVMNQMEKYEIDKKIEKLQEHDDHDVYLKANLIIDTYFEAEHAL
jgi:hypothetical protein